MKHEQEKPKSESEPAKEEQHHSRHHPHHHAHEGPCVCSSKVKASEEALHQTQKEAAEFKDKYLRALAEVENSRKRLTKEKIESQAFVMQEVICSFLEPLDQMERALEHASAATGDVQVWAKGFEMLLAQFKQILESYDVVAFSALGGIFDPHLHEALEVEERTDVPEGTILYEFKKGYKMGQKTIRPAKVRVSQVPQKVETIQEQQE